ncbi:uncharacterized protein OCT59_011479 [Rhizophagus irregularis]|uniref:uncharacterized protein n=1 Tax=Rhizophagus irregularis TaxID=588596 RepID=UPI00331F6A7E|nr:hypothetical protein OCT59_011479 [Rhizophagus irregularis]
MPLLMNINEELKLAYEDFRDNSAIPNSMPLFFEYTSFIFENERDNTILRRLRIGNVVSINIENRGNFAIIRAIFCHQKDNLRFVFVVVDWFEETNRTILGCPVYRLQTTNANLRRVFSICLVNAINVMHFVHNCRGEECIDGDHNSRNDLYIRNLYFLKLFNVYYLFINYHS